jgi:hypothetical protein
MSLASDPEKRLMRCIRGSFPSLDRDLQTLVSEGNQTRIGPVARE